MQEAESASASGNAVCYEILEGLKDGKIPLALQRVFTYETSAVRFAANGKIEWFIADAAPGELPVGTVYNEGEVRFEPLRIRTRNDEPSVPVLFVACVLHELTSRSRQLDVSFAVPSETEGSPFKYLDFGGGMTTAEEAHCYQYVLPRVKSGVVGPSNQGNLNDRALIDCRLALANRARRICYRQPGIVKGVA